MTNITNGKWQKSGSELNEKNYENSQYSRYFGTGSKHEHYENKANAIGPSQLSRSRHGLSVAISYFLTEARAEN